MEFFDNVKAKHTSKKLVAGVIVCSQMLWPIQTYANEVAGEGAGYVNQDPSKPVQPNYDNKNRGQDAIYGDYESYEFFNVFAFLLSGNPDVLPDDD